MVLYINRLLLHLNDLPRNTNSESISHYKTVPRNWHHYRLATRCPLRKPLLYLFLRAQTRLLVRVKRDHALDALRADEGRRAIAVQNLRNNNSRQESARKQGHGPDRIIPYALASKEKWTSKIAKTCPMTRENVGKRCSRLYLFARSGHHALRYVSRRFPPRSRFGRRLTSIKT